MLKKIFVKNEANKKSRWPVYALGFAVVLNIFFYGLMRLNASQEFAAVGAALTKEASQGLKIWIFEQRKVASLVSVSAQVQHWIDQPENPKYAEEVSRYLRSVISRYNQFENICIERFIDPKQPWKTPEDGFYDLNSYTISGQAAHTDAFINAGTVEAVLDGKSYYVSSILKSDESGKPIFYFSIPISKNNEILGIMTFHVKMSDFTNMLIQNIRYRQTGYLFVVDDRGETIAHANSSYVLSDEKYLVDIVNELLLPLKTGQNFFKGRFQGDWKLYYGIPSGLEPEFIRNQWYIAFTQHEYEVYRQANRFFIIMSLSSIGVLAFLVFYILRLEKIRIKLANESNERLEKEHLEEKLKQKTSEIVRQINMDQLTGISHFQSIQRYLEQQLGETNAEQIPLTLALFHVDSLGAFNEREGYALGDIILNFIGKMLKEVFPEDVVTGRLYGDVFAIVFKGETLIESLMLIEQFRGRYEAQGLALIPQKPTLSFGVVQWQGEKAGEMIQKAEHLLKKCKKEGPRQIKY